MANYHLGRGFLWSPTNLLYVAMAIATWLFFGPRLERCVEFEVGWIAQVYAINLVSTLLLAGGLHLYFYTIKCQGMERRIDPSEPGRNNPKFFGRAQVWTTCSIRASAVSPSGRAYVVLFMWLYANNLIPWLTWGTSMLGMLWFVLLFPLLVMWEQTRFYFVHRLLHTKQMWRCTHSITATSTSAHGRDSRCTHWSMFSISAASSST